ncbi:fibrobacter succinogenes major paralogous domain-containing protein [Sphingobacterium chungjuense]|uniref:FISUMP domain-containing protein n=1 Tax=Sphingobacterium chungjuense TaxID=2675553 RepID=UPI00140ADDB9|nr:FISUMP domain-containing protein [Sphingobacterium chungjuense]
MKTYHAILLTLLSLLYSCQKDQIDTSPGTVTVSVSEVVFEGEETISNRAATPNGQRFDPEAHIQTETLDLPNGLLLVSELKPAVLNQNYPQSLKDATRAVSDTSSVGAGIRYRLLVYNSAGNFVTERSYVRGQENATPALQLDGGSSYSFIVYSINSTQDNLPTVTPATNRTLTNSQISVSGTQDYMYFRQNLTVTGNSVNQLNIVLKHRFSQITTTVDASITGYNITALTSNFRPHFPTSLVNLSDGSFTRSGTETTSAVNYGTLGTQVVTSQPTMINSIAAGTGIFTIPNITINGIELTNLTPFQNLNITPGVRYNLTLNIVPTDENITYLNRPAVRINGRIWAQHNVGVATTLPVNPATITQAYHGNYYQFGRNTIVAANNATTVNSSWSNATSATAVPRNSWNTGSETAPVRTASDPCPAGWRVPTRTEVQQLLASVTATNRGDFATGNANFGSGKVLTSRRRADVIMVWPSQGLFNVASATPPTANPMDNRGSAGHYWTSSASGNNLWRLRFASDAQDISELTNDINYVAQSRNVRCTAI